MILIQNIYFTIDTMTEQAAQILEVFVNSLDNFEYDEELYMKTILHTPLPKIRLMVKTSETARHTKKLLRTILIFRQFHSTKSDLPTKEL